MCDMYLTDGERKIEKKKKIMVQICLTLTLLLKWIKCNQVLSCLEQMSLVGYLNLSPPPELPTVVLDPQPIYFIFHFSPTCLLIPATSQSTSWFQEQNNFEWFFWPIFLFRLAFYSWLKCRKHTDPKNIKKYFFFL